MGASLCAGWLGDDFWLGAGRSSDFGCWLVLAAGWFRLNSSNELSTLVALDGLSLVGGVMADVAAAGEFAAGEFAAGAGKMDVVGGNADEWGAIAAGGVGGVGGRSPLVEAWTTKDFD